MTSRGLHNGAARAALAVAMLLWLGACGGDDDGGGGDEGGSGGSSAGSGGSSGGSGGSGAGNGGSGGNSTGGGSGGTTGGTGGTLPMAMCDTSIPTTATCGGMECPASTSPAAALTCSVPCCTADDSCGLRNAIMGMATDCAGPAEEDPNCPGYHGMLMGMAVDLPGCCHSSGKCGAISSISMQCIVMSMFLTDLMPGDDCGGTDADGGS